jgi:hypothetical protein
MARSGYKGISKMSPEDAYDVGYRNGEDSAWADVQCGLEELGEFPDGTTFNEAMAWVREARERLS